MLFALHLWRREAVLGCEPAGTRKSGLIIAGSFSKTFAMTGWRIGYVLGAAAAHRRGHEAAEPVHVESQLRLRNMRRSKPLRGPMDSVGTMLAEYARRRERILAGLRAIPGVTCTAPQGAFYVFPNISAHLNADMPSDTAAAKQLLEREHVAVVPGEAFGAPGYLRISYATSIDRIDEGLRRLERFFGRPPGSKVNLCSGAAGACFQSAPVGFAFSCAVLSRTVRPCRADRRGLDDRETNAGLRTGRLQGGSSAKSGPRCRSNGPAPRSSADGDFPLLVKFIFTEDKLSVQVHPDDEYAASTRRPRADAARRKCGTRSRRVLVRKCLSGLKPEVTPRSFRRAIADGTAEDCLDARSAAAGDAIFVPAGTAHTIGPGLVLCEIQQHSDLTYRVYDYNRRDANGQTAPASRRKSPPGDSFRRAAWRENRAGASRAGCRDRRPILPPAAILPPRNGN